MDNSFREDEALYRSVYPPEIKDMFWKKDGTLSSAALLDKHGLSVERGYYRTDETVVLAMSKWFTGTVVKLHVKACNDVGALLVYKPTSRSQFHSEIHGSQDCLSLSHSQRKHLVEHAIIVKH